MTLALVDYGAGNLASVRKGFAAAGAELITPASPADLSRAHGIVIPGVGHFAVTERLNDAWRTAIVRRVEAGVPLLGVCLGLQFLFDDSTEAPGIPGLGLFAGTCDRLRASRPLKVPHVGWNVLERKSGSRLLSGVADDAYVYYTHSYAAPVTTACIASTTHGAPFAAAIEREQVWGVQFHPEKSGRTGLRILRNFVSLAHG